MNAYLLLAAGIFAPLGILTGIMLLKELHFERQRELRNRLANQAIENIKKGF